MTSAKAISSTRSSWTQKFAFPPVGRHAIGEVAFYWNGDDWEYGGAQEVYVLKASFEGVTDPVIEIGRNSKGAKIYTKSGFSYQMTDEYLKEVTYKDEVFVVLGIPSNYLVDSGIAKYNVLGFYGYNLESKRAVVCTLKGLDGTAYGADTVNPGLFVEHDQPSSNPAYAPPPYASGETLKQFQSSGSTVFLPTTIDKHAAGDADPQVTRAKLAEIGKVRSRASTDGLEDDEGDYEVFLEVLDLKEKTLRKMLRDAVAPNNGGRVTQYAVVDGKLVGITRRRSSLDKDKGEFGETSKQAFMDKVNETRVKMGYIEGKGFPFPKKAKEQEEPLVKGLTFSMPKSIQEDDETLL